jgi:hypothetical protein
MDVRDRREHDEPVELEEVAEEMDESTTGSTNGSPKDLLSLLWAFAFQSRLRLALLLGAAAALLLGALGLIALVLTIGGITLFGVSSTREGETWSHKDLALFLHKNGIVLHAVPTKEGGGVGPKMWFLTNSGDPVVSPGNSLLFFNPGLEAQADRAMEGLFKMDGGKRPPPKRKTPIKPQEQHRQGRLWVLKAETAQIAKDTEGSIGQGDEAFSWGRFLILGDPKLIAQIKKFLM